MERDVKLKSRRFMSFIIIILFVMVIFSIISKAEVIGSYTIKEKFSIYNYTEIIEIGENKNGKIWVIVPIKFEDLNYSFDYKFEFYLNYKPNFTISDIIVYPQNNLEGDEEQSKYLSYEITETSFIRSIDETHHTAKTLSITIPSNVTNKYKKYSFAFSYEVKDIVKLISNFDEPIDRYQIDSHYINVENIVDGNIHLFIILPLNADIPNINYFDSIGIEANQNLINKIELDYVTLNGTNHNDLRLPIDIQESEKNILYKNETPERYINFQYQFAKSWSFWALVLSIVAIIISPIISLTVLVYKKRKTKEDIPTTMNVKFVRIILAISCFLFLGTSLIVLFLIGDEFRGLALFGLGIAIYSVFLAVTSGRMMGFIGRSNFMRIDGNLKSITFQSLGRCIEKRDRMFVILSWRTNLIEAEKIKNFANDDERDSLAYPFTTVMKEIPWNDNRLTQKNCVSNSEVNWIIDIYRSIRHLNPKERTLDELQSLFYDYIAPINEGENSDQLLDIVQKIVQQNPNELFQRFQRIE